MNKLDCFGELKPENFDFVSEFAKEIEKNGFEINWNASETKCTFVIKLGNDRFLECQDATVEEFSISGSMYETEAKIISEILAKLQVRHRIELYSGGTDQKVGEVLTSYLHYQFPQENR